MTFGLFACTTSKSTDTLTLVATNQTQQLIEKLDIGNCYIGDIRAELTTTKDTPLKNSKLSELMKVMQTVDSISLAAISSIEQLKIQLIAIDNNTMHIDSTTIPFKIDYQKIKKPESHTPVKNMLRPKNGKELSSNLTKLNKILLELPAKLLNTHSTFGKFNPNFPTISQFDSKEEFLKKLNEKIDPITYNHKAERKIVEDIYVLLSRSQLKDNTHWLNEYFINTTLMEALIRLNLLQLNIIDARNLAIMSLSSKINLCGYSYTEIIALVEGPAAAEIGALATIKVGIGAFDEHNNPTVALNSQKAATITYQDGLAFITFPIKEKNNTITGTVAIRNKSGVKKELPFKWEVAGK